MMLIKNNYGWYFSKVPLENRCSAVAHNVYSRMFQAFSDLKWHELPTDDYDELHIIKGNLSAVHLVEPSDQAKHCGEMYKRLKKMIEKHGEGIL